MQKKLIITIGLIIALVGVGVVAYQELAPAKKTDEATGPGIQVDNPNTRQSTIYLLNNGSRTVLLSLPHPDIPGSIEFASLSPDNEHVAFTYLLNKRLGVFNIKNDEIQGEWGAGHHGTIVAKPMWSPNGDYLVIERSNSFLDVVVVDASSLETRFSTGDLDIRKEKFPEIVFWHDPQWIDEDTLLLIGTGKAGVENNFELDVKSNILRRR